MIFAYFNLALYIFEIVWGVFGFIMIKQLNLGLMDLVDKYFQYAGFMIGFVEFVIITNTNCYNYSPLA